VTVVDPQVDTRIDTAQPLSDGWWLEKLHRQLYDQQKRCEKLQQRYEGNSPLPFVSEIQQTAVKWFVEKSRTNWERLIVNAVLSRMRVAGIRTAVDSDEGGDAEAFQEWRRARMKLVTRDALKMMLAMSQSYVIVGKDDAGDVLITAEDPRLMTAITDPANPYKVLAALKVFYDDAHEQDVSYLYLPGRILKATKPRKARTTPPDIRFSPAAWSWDSATLAASSVDELAYRETDQGELPAMVCVAPLVNEDGMAEFEPFLNQIDRINQQILQRMTIATVQAFKQRAFKGLPVNDPKTGEKINWDAIFVADPGAVWNVPASVDIWESQEVNLQPILLAIRDDVKDLAATSGTPLYTITPDAAQGSAEGASLQREQVKAKVEDRQDRVEPVLELVAELMFRMAGDTARAQPRTTEIMWAPVDQPSMAERANAIAQTKGVIPRYQQMTEIWGMDPAQADRAMSELSADMVLDQQMAAAMAPPAAEAPQSRSQNRTRSDAAPTSS
jgi:hypothetical protein